MPDLTFTDAELDRLADVLADRVSARLTPAHTPGAPALLSLTDAARVLGCHPKTVRRRITDRSLPAVVVEGKPKVRADDLDTYVEGLERVGGTAPRRRARRGRDLGLDFLRE